MSIIDRYVVLESAGYLYAFNATDGALADAIDFSRRMSYWRGRYFSFSGINDTDIQDIAINPSERNSISTNHIYDLFTRERIFKRDFGATGVPLVSQEVAYFAFNDEWGRSSIIAFSLKSRAIAWETPLDGHRAILKFAPATDGKRIFIRSLSHLSALDCKTGSLAWSVKLTGKEREEGYRGRICFSAPVMFNGTVYLFRDEFIVPFRPKTGQTNHNSWRRYLRSIGLNSLDAGSNPILRRNRLFIAGGLSFARGQFAALGRNVEKCARICSYDIAAKKTIWELDVDFALVEHMSLGGKYLVTSDHSGRVLCLSSETGRILWGAELEGGVRVAPMIYFGRAYVGTDRGWLYCIAL